MPKGIKGAKNFIFPTGALTKLPSIQHMGGFSHERIDAMSSFVYGVTRPYAQLMHQLDPANGSKEFDKSQVSNKEAQSIHNLKYQRSKRLANLVMNDALDIGKDTVKTVRARKTPNPAKIRPFIGIENLSRLIPNDGRTRRENSTI
jgi:hypothetical protein